jgi:hypothetical protein
MPRARKNTSQAGKQTVLTQPMIQILFCLHFFPSTSFFFFFFLINLLKILGWSWWLTSIIPVTWEIQMGGQRLEVSLGKQSVRVGASGLLQHISANKEILFQETYF